MDGEIDYTQLSMLVRAAYKDERMLLGEATDAALAEGCRQVRAEESKATVTIKIVIEHEKGAELKLSSSVDVKLPKPKVQGTSFFVDRRGRLVDIEPDQGRLEGMTVIDGRAAAGGDQG